MKRKLLAVSVIIAASLLTGCVTPHPQMTRAEYLKTTNRIYPGKTPEQVFTAAEELFRLSDGNDFQIQYTDDTLSTQRRWSRYLVFTAIFGMDYWTVRAIPVDGGTKVTINEGTAANALVPLATAGGDISVTSIPGNATPSVGTALYDVFWERLDYLLGVKQHWLTCDEADKMVKGGVVWGDNTPLCNAFMKDESPMPASAQAVPQPEQHAVSATRGAASDSASPTFTVAPATVRSAQNPAPVATQAQTTVSVTVPARPQVFGARTRNLTRSEQSQFATYTGAMVESVDPQNPAALAGLQAGDVIREVNGHGVYNAPSFRKTITELTGQHMQLTIVRDGHTLSKDVALNSN
jgi:hypothetical protein